MRRSGSLIILLISLVLGGAAAFLARNWLESHASPATAEDTTTIVVANAPLAFGAAIDASDVKEVAWRGSAKPEGAFSRIEDLTKDGRRVALSPFVRDEPIVAAKVSAPNARPSLSAVIEEGKRAVTVPVDDVRGVAGFIFPGDFVDVILTRTNTTDGPPNFSEVILQHVKVLAIDQLSGERQERPTVAKAVTLEVTPDEALRILLATNIGKLSLILRQSAEAMLTPELRVTDHDLDGASAAPAAAPELPPPPSKTRKVTVVRAMKGEDYDVPID